MLLVLLYLSYVNLFKELFFSSLPLRASVSRFAWAVVASRKRMQRYDFFPNLQNFWKKKLIFCYCFNTCLQNRTISVGVHIILYKGRIGARRRCECLQMRPETASTERVYTPLPGIATQFLHLHEAALRRNVAYGEGCRSSPVARPTTRKCDNDG